MCNYLVEVYASNKSFDAAIGKIKGVKQVDSHAKERINDYVVMVMQYDDDMIYQCPNSMKYYIVESSYVFKYVYTTTFIARAIPLITLSPIIIYIYDTFLRIIMLATNIHINGDTNAVSLFYRYMREKSFYSQNIFGNSHREISIFVSETLCYVSVGSIQQCYFDLTKYSLLHYFTLEFIEKAFNFFMTESLLCDVIHCDAYDNTRECKTSRFFHVIDFSY